MIRSLLDWLLGWRGDVSAEWIADQRRRELGSGIDQSVISQWPIDKHENDACPRINAHRLKVKS